MSSKQIVEPTEEINILLRRTAVPKCDITPAVKGLRNECISLCACHLFMLMLFYSIYAKLC